METTVDRYSDKGKRTEPAAAMFEPRPLPGRAYHSASTNASLPFIARASVNTAHCNPSRDISTHKRNSRTFFNLFQRCGHCPGISQTPMAADEERHRFKFSSHPLLWAGTMVVFDKRAISFRGLCVSSYFFLTIYFEL
jgi:hypothetical protein